MNKIDLIIDALENCKGLTQIDRAHLKKALAAARELKALQPVAWMWKDGTVTTDPDRADGTWTKLYALDEVNYD